MFDAAPWYPGPALEEQVQASLTASSAAERSLLPPRRRAHAAAGGKCQHDAWFVLGSGRLCLQPCMGTSSLVADVGCTLQVWASPNAGSAMQVGQPGVEGLSVEQRKRLTIAVELVANPSIVFMDEPTSGVSVQGLSYSSSAWPVPAWLMICALHQRSGIYAGI